MERLLGPAALPDWQGVVRLHSTGASLRSGWQCGKRTLGSL